MAGSALRRPAILDLTFAVESRFRPFHLVAPDFVAATAEPGGMTSLTLAEEGPVAPYAAVEVTVAALDQGVVGAGLASADEHVLATYDPGRARVAVEVRRAGRTRLVRRKRIELPTTFRLAFVLCADEVTVLVDTGGGWQPVLTTRGRLSRLVDPRDPTILGGLRYAWGALAGAAVLDGVRAGLFGMTGLRDPHLVQHADGTPVTRGGRMFLTATCAGPGPFAQGHWGVFALDPADPTSLAQVAQLFFRRDGLVLGDHAGQLVRDGGEWIVVNSAWGDFDGAGVHVRHARTSADLLSGVHVIETRPLELPTSLSTWDPGLTRIDGRWHVSFVQSPSQKPFDFHPALAVGDSYCSGLSLAGAASELHQCEGPVIVQLDDEWFVLASDKERHRYPVFDLGLRRRGDLRAPYLSNIPHPQLVPVEDGGWMMVSFDGTPYAQRVLGYGTHGDVVVMRTPIS